MRSPQCHRNKKARNEQGFSLIDVLGAVAVLTIGLLGIASMHVGAMQGNFLAGHVTEGTTWAQDKLEELLALPYDDINADTSPEQQGDYTIAWTVVDDTGGAPANTKMITVTVTWQNKGAAQATQLTCLKPQL
jgi:Tfp pilus assembly protein PilV